MTLVPVLNDPSHSRPYMLPWSVVIKAFRRKICPTTLTTYRILVNKYSPVRNVPSLLLQYKQQMCDNRALTRSAELCLNGWRLCIHFSRSKTRHSMAPLRFSGEEHCVFSAVLHKLVRFSPEFVWSNFHWRKGILKKNAWISRIRGTHW
jgi:hypothetical protein